MYGFFTRRITWTSALRTTTQRATCSTIPRQLSLTVFGSCQVRLQSQVTVATAAAGMLWPQKAKSRTWEIDVSNTRARSGATNNTSIDSDQSTYQVCTNRNWSAWRGL